MSMLHTFIATFFGAFIGLFLGALLNVWVVKKTTKEQVHLQLKIDVIKELIEKLHECYAQCNQLFKEIDNVDNFIHVVKSISEIDNYMTAFAFLSDYKHDLRQLFSFTFSNLDIDEKSHSIDDFQKHNLYEERSEIFKIADECTNLSNKLIMLLPKL